jgi:lipid II:glycine glycyltransferase (peptidoglycan interpeptide bridge formation enzyme)
VAAAMVLKRTVLNRGFAARLCILYIPKGPLLDWSDVTLRKQVLDDLQEFAKKQGAIFLKLDPDVIIGSSGIENENAREDEDGLNLISELKQRGWLFSKDQIQFRNTVLIDVSLPSDQMLTRMKQKARYNVHLAERKGVTVRAGSLDDLPMLFKMYAITSVRDGFVIRDEGYYRNVWETFMKPSNANDQPFAEPLIAEVNGEAVAAIFIFYFVRQAYYLYGMSLETHREKMPNYLLQWDAMKRAKARGCSVYDLWGAPDEFNETDPMWGVYRFKEGLGGEVIRTIGAWDFPVNSLWYKTYTNILPRVLDIMRARGKTHTQQELG